YCEAMRPKLAGVTSTSTSSPSCASDLMRRASKTEIWSCLESTFSETTNLASALMSPLLRSMDTRNSRAGPTAFLAAATSDSSTAAMRTSLEMPFSRSQKSRTAKKSEFITTSATGTSPRGEQKSRKNQFSDLHVLASQQTYYIRSNYR